MTPDQIIHARRAHVLEQAALTDVTAACKAAGVSRTSYYRWVAKAEKYGLSALMPKDRRPPVMPNAMSAEEVSTILATAVAKATLGARQLVDHLAAAGVHRSASGIQKVLRRHNLGNRRQRIAALASLTAADSGQLTDAAMEGPFATGYSPSSTSMTSKWSPARSAFAWTSRSPSRVATNTAPPMVDLHGTPTGHLPARAPLDRRTPTGQEPLRHGTRTTRPDTRHVPGADAHPADPTSSGRRERPRSRVR